MNPFAIALLMTLYAGGLAHAAFCFREAQTEQSVRPLASVPPVLLALHGFIVWALLQV